MRAGGVGRRQLLGASLLPRRGRDRAPMPKLLPWFLRCRRGAGSCSRWSSLSNSACGCQMTHAAFQVLEMPFPKNKSRAGPEELRAVPQKEQSSRSSLLFRQILGWAFISVAWLHEGAFCPGTECEYYSPFPKCQKCFSRFFLLGFPSGVGGM